MYDLYWFTRASIYGYVYAAGNEFRGLRERDVSGLYTEVFADRCVPVALALHLRPAHVYTVRLAWFLSIAKPACTLQCLISHFNRFHYAALCFAGLNLILCPVWHTSSTSWKLESARNLTNVDVLSYADCQCTGQCCWQYARSARGLMSGSRSPQSGQQLRLGERCFERWRGLGSGRSPVRTSCGQ